MDEIQIDLEKEEHLIQKFKDWIENNYLKSFNTYWQQRDWPIVL